MISRGIKRMVDLILQIPLLVYLKKYTWRDFRADSKAAVNVSLLDFPQGMAYALIAGLPVPFGIYSSAIGSLVGPIFASSRFLMLGPTNASAVLLMSGLMVLNVTEEQKLAALPLLLLMVALFLIVGAIIRAHVVLQFVSRSVVTGYITAAACLIIVNQLKYVVGVSLPRAGTFFESLKLTVMHLPESHYETVILSAITLAVYLVSKKWIKVLPAVAVSLMVMAVVNYFLVRAGWELPTLDALPLGAWPLTLPVFSLSSIHQLASPAFAIAFLSLLESSSIAKTLAARAGETVNIRQQMVSMGLADIGNAFASGMPVSGSLTRSALNFESGARTPVASMISGSILVVGVLSLGPLIGTIPKATLATLVMMVGISLFNKETLRVVMTTTKSDMATFLTTFLGGLFFPLDMAIYLGVGISLIFFLRKVARPEIVEYAFDKEGRMGVAKELAGPKKPAISIIHIEGNLFFGAADLFLEEMRRLVSYPEVKAVILRLRNAHNMDASAALAMKELIEFANERGCHVLMSGVHEELESIMEKSGLLQQMGPDNIFRSTPENLTLSTRNALARAQELLGRRDLDIRLLTPGKAESSHAS
jgi:SulP family sulfate permease